MADGLRPQVVIVGAGPAASAAAITLARHGCRVSLLGGGRRDPQGEGRIEILASAGLTILARLGVTVGDLAPFARRCPGAWSRWGEPQARTTDYVTSAYGAAMSVDRCLFDRCLLDIAASLGVVIELDAVARSCSAAISHAIAVKTVIRTLQADWLILAVGPNTAKCRPRLDHPPDDRIVALVARAETAPIWGPVDARLLIEALPDGWCYGIRGPRTSVGIGLVTDRECLRGQDMQSFAMHAVAQTDRIQLLLKDCWPLVFHATPIVCRQSYMPSRSHVIRVGDAAACYDPIAGRGLFEALRTAEDTAVAITRGTAALDAVKAAAGPRYNQYLFERELLYQMGRERFGTPFWIRRCLTLLPNSGPVGSSVMRR